MKHVLQNSKVLLFAGLSVIVIGASAWQIQTDSTATNNNYEQACTDTTRPRSVHSDKIDLGVNTDSILKAAQTALSAVDFNKLQQQINVSLAKINFDEINKTVEASLKNIDWEKMQAEINASLDEVKIDLAKVNTDEIKAELEKAKAEIAKINTAEIKKELEEAKRELKQAQLEQKIDVEKMEKEVKESMAEAKKEIEKAKAEIANYKAFVAVLEKDGLIKAGEPYSVELKDNVLYINGVKQKEEITEKYRKYYGGKTHFSLYDSKREKDRDEDDEDGTDL